MSAWDNVELSIGGKPVEIVTVDVDPAALDRTTTAPKQVDKRDIVQRLRWLAEELFDDADAAEAADEIERFRQFEADVFHLLGEYGEPDKFGDCRCGVKNCPVLGRINEWLRQRWDGEGAK